MKRLITTDLEEKCLACETRTPNFELGVRLLELETKLLECYVRVCEMLLGNGMYVHVRVPFVGGSTEDWREARMSFYRVNASAMPTICRNNPWAGPQDEAWKRVWHKHRPFYDHCVKPVQELYPTTRPEVYQLRPELQSSAERSEKIKMFNINRGINNEPVAKTYYEKETGHKLLPLNDRNIYSSPQIMENKLGVTFDGLTYCGKLLEFKCPRKVDKAKVKMYNDQVQSALWVLGLDEGLLYQYDVKEPANSRGFEIKKDQGWLEFAEPHVRDFGDLIDVLDSSFPQK